MPITFEQPQPFAPQLAAAYGAAQQQARGGGGANIGAVLGAFETAARLRQASQGEAAQLAQRQTEANYGNAQQALIQDSRRQQEEQDRALRAHALVLAQQPSARDAFQAQAEFQTRAGLAQINAELQQQELSYTEQLRMQRMDQALTSVMSNPKLSEEERLMLATQIKSGLDPYRARQEKARARQEEQLAQKYEQQTELQTKVQAKRAVFDAQTLPERTVRIPMEDGSTATMVQTGIDNQGNPTYTHVKPEKQVAGKAEKPFDEKYWAQTAPLMAREQIKPDLEPLDPGGKATYKPETQVDVDRRVATLVTEARDAHEEGRKPDWFGAIAREKAVKEAIKNGESPPPSRKGSPNDAAKGYGGGQPQQPIPTRAENKPYQPGQPTTDDQKAQDKDWAGFEWRARQLGPGQREQVLGQIQWARQALATFGDRTAMSPEVGQHYDAIVKSVDGLKTFSPASRPRLIGGM